MCKIIVLGHGDHGKDVFAEMLAKKLNLTFKSSSIFACERIVYPVLKDKYNYQSVLECYNDRRNHREEWKVLIKEYNKEDLSRLAKELFKEFDIYVGLRDKEEFEAIKRDIRLDDVIWVDASLRKPLESKKSFNIEKDASMSIINNNLDLKNLEAEVNTYSAFLVKFLKGDK